MYTDVGSDLKVHRVKVFGLLIAFLGSHPLAKVLPPMIVLTLCVSGPE